MGIKPVHAFLDPTLGYLAARNAEQDAERANRKAAAAVEGAALDLSFARVQFQQEVERIRADYDQQLLHAKRLIHSEAAAKEALARALHAVAPDHPLIAISPDGTEMALPDLDHVRLSAYESTPKDAPLQPRVVWPTSA